MAVVEWVDPPFPAGHWVPDLVRRRGWRAGRGPSRCASVQMTWADIAAASPDLVLVAPCGYHLAGAAAQAALVAQALPGLPVWAIDADGLVVRPGPRLVDGVAAIAILHPEAVPPPPDAIRLVDPPGWQAVRLVPTERSGDSAP